MEHLSTDNIIESLYLCGIRSTANIDRYLRGAVRAVSDRTLRRKLAQIDEDGRIPPERYHERGRKPLLTQKHRQKILEILEEEPNLNCTEILQRTKFTCHPSTIYRYLQSEQLIWMLIERHRLNRIAFAIAHINDNWDSTIVLDESTFTLFNQRRFAYQRKGEKRKRQKPKHPEKIHVCGAFSIRGPLRLHFFKKNLDGKYFRTILRTAIIPDAKNLYKMKAFRLLQDRDPKHQSSIVQDYLKEVKIPTIEDWPGGSPDINPVENLWGIIKTELSKQPKSHTIVQLKTKIRRIWRQRVDADLCHNLVRSMGDRLSEVIAKNGNRTSY